jgi:hypothetical protein
MPVILARLLAVSAVIAACAKSESQPPAEPPAPVAAERASPVAAQRAAPIAAERASAIAVERSSAIASRRSSTIAAERESLLAVERDSAIAAESRSPIAVEIIRSGDDGLTLRFADTLRTALLRSRTYRLSSREQPATLTFDIPRSLRWTEIDGRVQAQFQVDFKSGGSRILGTSRGTCWETELNACVARVLSDAPRWSDSFSR